MRMISKIVRMIFFVLFGGILYFYCSYVFVGSTDYNYQQSAVFLEEAKGSLDAVYIGASPTFTSWIAPLAYGKYGITMRTFANDSQPFVAVENLFKIARKRQPNAVYLIAINGVYEKDELSVESAHRTIDFLPYSIDRFSLIHKLHKDFQYTSAGYLELIFPIIRYHSIWNSLSKDYFHRNSQSLKGGFIQSVFLNTNEDISGSFCETSEREPLSDFTQKALIELLDYCKKENVKVVFVLSAQYRSKNILEQYNAIIDEINKYGFPLINELKDFDEIGLNDKTDFYNFWHTNIHGALKITDYLAQYLIDNYDFEDKRGGYSICRLGRSI